MTTVLVGPDNVYCQGMGTNKRANMPAPRPKRDPSRTAPNQRLDPEDLAKQNGLYGVWLVCAQTGRYHDAPGKCLHG